MSQYRVTQAGWFLGRYRKVGAMLTLTAMQAAAFPGRLEPAGT